MSHSPGDLTPLPDLLHGAALAGPATDPQTHLHGPASRRATHAARPRRISRPGWPPPRPRARAGLAGAGRRQPVSGHPRPRLATTRARTRATGPSSTAQSRSTRFERFLGDLALEQGWQLDSPPHRTGNRVLVVGAGPSGLSAAYHLARRGHEVEIRDASPEPGGMMRYGIPAYRLPRDVLAGEVARLGVLGVRLTCGRRVTDLAAEHAEGRFDAVFVAVGAHLSKHVDIPARDASRIIDAVPFLRDVAGGARPAIGRRVAVYGGGNTAMDAARGQVRPVLQGVHPGHGGRRLRRARPEPAPAAVHGRHHR